MKITKEQLKQIIKEELGKNYHLGRHQHGNPTTLYINFRNLKDVGENMPGGVDPNKISELLEQAFYDNNADYFLHHPFVKVDNTGGGGYIDPSQSKYKVFLNFEDEQQYEDFKTEELDLIMQQANDKVEKYAMELRQYKLDLKEGKITKEQLKQIIKEELASIIDGSGGNPDLRKQAESDGWRDFNAETFGTDENYEEKGAHWETFEDGKYLEDYELGWRNAEIEHDLTLERKKIKITKEQLKRIIKEELTRLEAGEKVELEEVLDKYNPFRTWAQSEFQADEFKRWGAGRGSMPRMDMEKFEKWFNQNEKDLRVKYEQNKIAAKTRTQTDQSRQAVGRLHDPEWDLKTDPDSDVWEGVKK